MPTIEPTIVTDIKSKLTDLKDKMKTEKLDSSVFTSISGYAKQLQDKLDALLQKKGIYTQSDLNDAQLLLSDIRRKEMELEGTRYANKSIMVGFLAVLGIVALVIVFKND